jgi:UDP-N-acetylmuramoylalanine-D-glutamate ligase
MAKVPASIAIWGFGREGQAALRYVQQHYPQAEVAILNDNSLTTTPTNIPVYTGAEVAQQLASGHWDWVIKAPGISLYRPEVAAAKAAGSQITSGTNLWFAAHPQAKTIAVTGTKGKSTTTVLIHHLLSVGGYHSVVAGNMGTPLLDVTPGRDATVIELSSYQIADLQHGPTIAALTSLYPEHADWHGSHQQYYRDKLHLAALTPTVLAAQANLLLQQHLTEQPNMQWIEPTIHPDFPLKGPHNASNLGVAIAAIAALGIDPQPLLPHLKTFQPLAHRLQELGTRAGITYVNDSIATVPEATRAALDAYPNTPVWLILGGYDRGQDYTALLASLDPRNVTHVLCLPATGERIAAQLAEQNNIDYSAHPDLASAVAHAQQNAPHGTTLLLSPGAPSYGSYPDFTARGHHFAELAGVSLAR